MTSSSLLNLKPTLIFAAALVLLSASLCSCHTIDDDRVPYAPVSINFNTIADWNVYGVGGALSYRSFIRELRQPANYHYSEMTYTGFGGVLLVGDVLGEPRAFDLCCPVECRKDVRVKVDTEEMVARCPECGSAYNVFSLMGHPISGPAAERGYGLRAYRVGPGRNGTPYMSITH